MAARRPALLLAAALSVSLRDTAASGFFDWNFDVDKVHATTPTPVMAEAKTPSMAGAMAWTDKVCASTLRVTGAEAVQPEDMGTFTKSAIESSSVLLMKTVYMNGAGQYLFYYAAKAAWIVGPDYTAAGGNTYATQDVGCPEEISVSWHTWDGKLWSEAYYISVTASNEAHTFVYMCGVDKKVYKQELDIATHSSAWLVAGKGDVLSIAIDGDTIFAVQEDSRIYRQTISHMTPTSSWELASAPGAVSIATDGVQMYAVGSDMKVHAQPLFQMDANSAWSLVGDGYMLSIAFAGDFIYGVGNDFRIFKQALSTMSTSSPWLVTGKGAVVSIAIEGGSIYAVGKDKLIYTQALETMTPSSSWSVAAKGDAVSLAISQDLAVIEKTCEGTQTEEGACPNQPDCEPCVPVNCAFSEWGAWSSTFTSHLERGLWSDLLSKETPCVGLCARKRKITTYANNCGALCAGILEEREACPAANCLSTYKLHPSVAEDCLLEAWTSWTTCQIHGSQSNRSRQIVRNSSHGGTACSGALTEVKPCSTTEDCVLSPWSDWAACSAVCSGGHTSRSRYVSKHATGNGEKCNATIFEEITCNSHGCYDAVDCETTDWALWSECLLLGSSIGQRTRTRSIRKPTYRGKACKDALKEVVGCSDPVNCALSPWTDWSECTKTCGGGQKRRSRHMPRDASRGGSCAMASLADMSACSSDSCYQDANDCYLSHWGHWSACHVSCGQGLKKRTRSIREARSAGRPCKPDSLDDLASCVQPPCPPSDCKWSDWTSQGDCSKTCGGGMGIRYRNVTSFPSYGGGCFPQSVFDMSMCNPEPCATRCYNGSFSQWTEWSSCSASCGSGYKKRTRLVATYPNDCGFPTTGPVEEFTSCAKVTGTCTPFPDVDCTASAWSRWSDCADPCSGVYSRTRHIEVYAHGRGSSCDNMILDEIRPCRYRDRAPAVANKNFAVHPANKSCSNFDNKLSVDCEMSEWTLFTACSATCGGGAVVKTRNVIPPMHNGMPCKGASMLVEPCNLAPCPEAKMCKNCLWTTWSDWEACTSCTGQRTRRRDIDTMGNYCGVPCKAAAAVESSSCVGTASCLLYQYCTWAQWSSWSECPARCGMHRTSRTRNLDWTRNADSYLFKVGDARQESSLCSSRQESVRFCSSCGQGQNCPVDICRLSEWTPWHTGSGSTRGVQRLTDAQVCSRTRFAPMASDLFSSCCADMQESIRETKSCNTVSDCVLGQWNMWTECAEHVVQRQRVRQVERLSANAGKPCVATLKESQPCNPHFRPPLDCIVSTWSSWSMCDRACGGGQRLRQRQVNEYPKRGGLACPVNLEEVEPCNSENLCEKQRNCTTSAWLEWALCDATCGVGNSIRTREVLAMRTYAKGTSCNEGLRETRKCAGLETCHTSSCLWDEWSSWGACTQKCRGQTIRQRSIKTVPSPNMGSCPAKTQEETVACNVNSTSCDTCYSGKWAAWSHWSCCSGTCEGGFTWRSRKVAIEAAKCGTPPDGLSQQVVPCNVDVSCDTTNCKFGEWHEWTACSSTCNGIRDRARYISVFASGDGAFCEGPLKEVGSCQTWGGENCDEQPCQFGLWTSWGNCSVPCGGGERLRSRPLIQRSATCQGSLTQMRGCNTQLCNAPVDCSWLDWSEWGACNICGGVRHRNRTLVTQGMHGGRACVAADAAQVSRCSHDCPRLKHTMCAWASWSSWTTCSLSCGKGGKRARTRLLQLVNSSLIGAGSFMNGHRLEDAVKELYLKSQRTESTRAQHLSIAFLSGCAVVAGLAMMSTDRWRWHGAAADLHSQQISSDEARSARRIFLI